MKRKLQLLIKQNRRIIPGIAVICVLVVLLIIKAGYDYHKATLDEIATYEDLLERSSLVLARGDNVGKLIDDARLGISKLEKGLLKADKPSIGAAKLQEAVKKMSSQKKITIKSENALNFEEAGAYVKVPVEFHFKAKLSQLNDLLYEIRSSPLLMGVSSMRIKAADQTDPSRLNVALVVVGAFKKNGEL